MAPIGSYIDNAFFKGFQEGYLTMDTLASFVFGIIVINAIKANGITTKGGIAKATIKAGLIASGALGIIYLGLAYLGATTNFAAGEANNGGATLNICIKHPFFSLG